MRGTLTKHKTNLGCHGTRRFERNERKFLEPFASLRPAPATGSPSTGLTGGRTSSAMRQVKRRKNRISIGFDFSIFMLALDRAMSSPPNFVAYAAPVMFRRSLFRRYLDDARDLRVHAQVNSRRLNLGKVNTRKKFFYMFRNK